MDVVLAQGLDLASHQTGGALIRINRIGLDDIERIGAVPLRGQVGEA